MLKAVLFDLDQTLVDWDHVEQPWDEYQYQRILNVYGYVNEHLHALNSIDPQGFFEAYLAELGNAWRQSSRTLHAPDVAAILAETLRACGVPDDRIDRDGLVDAYDWQAPPGERAYPDTFEVLPQLRAQGVELGIVTNSAHPMRLRDRELQSVGLLDLFPCCRLSAVDVGYLKPHRRIFEHALNVMDVRPDEAVFVGDNLAADIGGAQSVGMRAVWRVTEMLDEVEAEIDGDEITPDGTIVTLHDLLPLLDTWYPGWRNGAA